MKAFLCSLLFLFLMHYASGQDFVNPYPLTSELTDCSSFADYYGAEYSESLTNYYFDKSNRLVKAISYYGKLLHSDTLYWKGSDTIVYNYDSSGEYVNWQHGQYKYENKFDANNKISWYKRYKNGKLVLFGTFQYNAQNKLVGINYYNAKDGAPFLRNDTESIVSLPYKAFYTYNSSGRQIQLIYLQSDSFGTNWQPVYQDDSLYDASGHDTAGLHYIWKNNSWQLSNAESTIYSNGTLKCRLKYSIDGNGNRKVYNIDSFFYSSAGILLKTIAYGVNSSDTAVKEKYDYVYYADGNLKAENVTPYDNSFESYTITYDDKSGKRTGQESLGRTESWEYDNGRLTSYSYSQKTGPGYSENNCSWNYYYGEYPFILVNAVSIAKQSQITFGTFNNPVRDKLEIDVQDSVSEGFQLTLYSSTGRKVYDQSTTLSPGITHFEIDMQNLERGIYILIARKGNNVYEKKIVKV